MARSWLRNVLLDPTGVPIASASVYLYQWGTTTPVTYSLYASRTGGSPVSQPLTTDSTGEYEVWADVPGDRVTVQGVKTGYTIPAETGDFSIDPGDILSHWIDITSRHYGAVGDGATDCSTAIANAIIAAGVGGTIYVPYGSFIANAPQTLSLANQTIRGDGYGSVIKAKNSAALPELFIATAAGVRLIDLKLDGNRDNLGISASGGAKSTVIFQAAHGLIQGCELTGGQRLTVNLNDDADYFRFVDNYVHNNGLLAAEGASGVSDGGATNGPDHVVVDRCRFIENYGNGGNYVGSGVSLKGKHAKILNSLFQNNYNLGGQIVQEAIGATEMDWLIAGNTILLSSEPAAPSATSAMELYDCGIVVTNNIINGAPSQATTAAIIWDGFGGQTAGGGTIANNRFVNCAVAINMGTNGAVDGVVVANNSAMQTSGARTGLKLSATCTNIAHTGNDWGNLTTPVNSVAAAAEFNSFGNRPAGVQAWQNWTPILYQNINVPPTGGAFIALSSNVSKWRLVDKTAQLRVQIVANAAGTAGSRIIIGGIPTGLTPLQASSLCGWGRYSDSGAAFYAITALYETTYEGFVLYGHNLASFLGATITVAANDVLDIYFEFEV